MHGPSNRSVVIISALLTLLRRSQPVASSRSGRGSGEIVIGRRADPWSVSEPPDRVSAIHRIASSLRYGTSHVLLSLTGG